MDAPLASQPLLGSLRAATHAAHERLHVHPALCHLAGDEVTRDYWLSALKLFYGFHRPLEEAYARSGSPLLAAFPALQATTHLEQDFAAAGIDAGALPLCAAAPLTHEAALAYLYLREGSNLGGKVISRNLERRLGLRPGIDNHFFWGHGEAAGAVWRGFQQALADAKVDAAASARDAALFFSRLEEWLTVRHRERSHVA